MYEEDRSIGELSLKALYFASNCVILGVEVRNVKFLYEANRIFARTPDGTLTAEITFPMQDGIANINHTFVDASLRGQGIAGKLVADAVDEIRKKGWKATATCSYAKRWFDTHPEACDVLVKQ